MQSHCASRKLLKLNDDNQKAVIIQCFPLIFWNINISIPVYLYVYRVDEHLNIKVADFGLARDVYMNDYYRQQSTCKIPVKWMAPEALNDKISNEKTDVVSLRV